MDKNSFENFLIDVHSKQVVCVLDDEMPDDFDEWLQELGVDEVIEYAEKWNKILSSGCVHRDDVLRCLDTFYVDCDEEGNYPCDPQYNQVIDEVKQALENLGKDEK